MAIRTTYSAETWDKIYQAFSAVSFVSYDFDSIKQSLVDYTRTYYPEHFNDYIQSSEFVAVLEMFAYIAEQLAYRVDMVAHENFISTAQRKQSILRLAKLISYKATRNIPVRGLVKINTISTTERVIDSRGTNLSGLTITWNDPNNLNWKEQFLLVMNRVLATRFGQPQNKSVQIGDVVMDLYSLNNTPGQLTNGVFAFTATTGLESYPMEVVPVELDDNGPYEREPDLSSSLSIIYANDGIGDGSDYTGFLMFVKQGTLSRIDYDIDKQLPDRRIEFGPQNVNHTDVWVQGLAEDGTISERWSQVDTISEENLVFNSIRDTRKKFEVDTRENDQISVIFGDGDFSDMPVGSYRFWMRQSANRSVVIQKNKIVNQSMSFGYTSSIGNSETCSFTFSLTSTLQNGSASETIDHIRRAAPSTYYAQNRMVNGQDYNTYLMKDPTILRMTAINRTFAGQPKYIDWNDASGQYENVKMFGDDLVMRYKLSSNTVNTTVSGKALIDEIIEPLLKESGVVNMLLHILATNPDTIGVISAPRRSFIEDNRAIYKDISGNPLTVSGTGNLKEKTAIQGVIDQHWYGEPLSTVQDSSGNLMGVIPDPTLYPEDDSLLYDSTLPRTIDGVNLYPPGDTGSGIQRSVSPSNYFGLRYNRTMTMIGDGSITVYGTVGSDWITQGYWKANEVWTIEVLADGETLGVRSNLRGTFASGTIDEDYEIQPVGFSDSVKMFKVVSGSIAFKPGDAFILDTSNSGVLSARVSPNITGGRINLNGWWEVMNVSQMTGYASGMKDDQQFTTADTEDSWIIFVRKLFSSSTLIGYEVHFRELKLLVQSNNTKFWYNNTDQILDADTKKRVYDTIKILRSNVTMLTGLPMSASQSYDVIGAVTDSDGVIDVNQLEIVPTDLMQEDTSGDLTPDRLLQFENFAVGSYEYFLVGDADQTVLTGASLTAAMNASWTAGAMADDSGTYGRNLRMPSLETGGDSGLDFMWQHYSPFTNIIDPSPTNIHDVYVLTRGYYDSVIDYLRGDSVDAPSAPTPLELRNSYGSLLDKKMMSDTIVLHPGKIRLLFGSLAEAQLRAKFRVVRGVAATLTNERIKEEILSVINTYFSIDNWDFGDTFYATELLSLIHQRLPVDVATVVLVPLYGSNSFGSMFTVESGIDEILQSAAEISDIEIVDALTASVIRQVK